MDPWKLLREKRIASSSNQPLQVASTQVGSRDQPFTLPDSTPSHTRGLDRSGEFQRRP